MIVMSSYKSTPHGDKLPTPVVIGVAIFAVLSMTAAVSAQTAEGYVVKTTGTARYADSPEPTGYASLAAGGELLMFGRVGGVVDFDWVSFGATSISLGGVVHVQIHRGQKLIPYVRAGYAHTTGDRLGNGPDVSVGVSYWPWRRVGFRAEFYDRVQHSEFTYHGSSVVYTELYRLARFGVAFR